jgi:hypothetical protein
MRKDKQINNVVVDTESISYKQSSVWPVTNSLQSMSKRSIITATAYLSPIVRRIPGHLKDIRHVVYFCCSHFSGIPQLVPRVISLGMNDALQMVPQVEVGSSEIR